MCYPAHARGNACTKHAHVREGIEIPSSICNRFCALMDLLEAHKQNSQKLYMYGMHLQVALHGSIEGQLDSKLNSQNERSGTSSPLKTHSCMQVSLTWTN